MAFLSLPGEKKAEPLRVRKRKEPAARSRRTKLKSQELARKPAPPAEKAPPLSEGSKTRPGKSEARPLKAGARKTIVRHPLPSLEELLPPINWPRSGERSIEEKAVRLDTQEPKYSSYLSTIKRAIELVWQYPEPALRRGRQGKLILKFTILGNGTLIGIHLIRSSGFSILDEEAIRAVQAAAPFHPIPTRIAKNRLAIIASFEYLDNRLKYTFAP
ncbi:MAG: energy transducer TonB [Candidatus Binatia bacterium]